MHSQIRLAGAVLTALGAFASLPAQSAQPAPDEKAMTDALKLRSDMSGTIASGSEKPDAAIARLRAQSSPTGLKINPDADFAFAAIDVGQRLIAGGKAAEAEAFFQEAEKSLDIAVQNTPDTQARDKAMFLQKQALIRSKYLNKASQAKADIDRAVALQPDDKYFAIFRDHLATDQAAVFQAKPKG